MRHRAGRLRRGALVACLLGAGLLAPLVVRAEAADLIALYDLALTNSTDLSVARSKHEVAREIIPQARAEMLPRFGLRVTRGKFQQRRTIRGIKVPEELYDNEGNGIEFQMPIFRPGLIAQYVRSKHVVAGSQADLDAARRYMAGELMAAYLEALRAAEQAALVGRQIKRALTERRAAESALVGGTGTRTAIDEANAEVERLKADQIESRQALAYALDTLAAAAGEQVTAVAGLGETRFAPLDFVPEEYAALYARGDAANPEIESLRRQIDVARAEEKMSWSAHLPTLDAVGQWGNELGSNPYFADNGYSAESITLQVRMPLFSGGGDLSRDREAAAKVVAAEDELRRAQTRLGLQIRQETSLLENGASRISALNTAAAAYETAIRSTRMGLQAGTRTLLDVLEAERQEYQVRVALIEQRYELLGAWGRLQMVSGMPEREVLGRINALLDGAAPVPAAQAPGADAEG